MVPALHHDPPMNRVAVFYQLLHTNSLASQDEGRIIERRIDARIRKSQRTRWLRRKQVEVLKVAQSWNYPEATAAQIGREVENLARAYCPRPIDESGSWYSVLGQRIRTALNRRMQKEVEVVDACTYELKRKPTSLKVDCRDFIWPIKCKEYKAHSSGESAWTYSDC
jgi:hypothetical protein